VRAKLCAALLFIKTERSSNWSQIATTLEGNMNATQQRIVDAFNEHHYLTSSDLVNLAGYRYSARLHELRGMGYAFPWGFMHDIHGRKTNTTIYTCKKLDKLN